MEEGNRRLERKLKMTENVMQEEKQKLEEKLEEEKKKQKREGEEGKMKTSELVGQLEEALG